MRNTMKMALTASALALMATGAVLLAPVVVADERYPPVTDEMTMKECGDCHMAFQPAFLPARSWARIMDNLQDHFGEDASLPEDKVKHIKAYLMANAADKRWRSKMMRGVRKDWTPMRISELPYWKHEHDEVSPGAWKDPRIKSKANCKACHKRADRGIYDDEEYEYRMKYGGKHRGDDDGYKYRRGSGDDDDYKYRRKYRDDDDYKYRRKYRDDDGYKYRRKYRDDDDD